MAATCAHVPRRLLQASNLRGVGRTVAAQHPCVAPRLHAPPCARADITAVGSVGATRTFLLTTRHRVGEGAEVHEPVVFLHGLLGSLTSLGTISRAPEVAAGRQVVTLDMRNHGHSPHSDDMSWTAMADDVIETVDEVCGAGRQFTVLGHSLGGKVAMALAMTHPSRVRSIVVADVAPVKYQWTDDDPLSVPSVVRAAHSLDLASFESRRDVQEALFKLLPNEGIVQFVIQNLEVDDSGRLAWRMNLDVFQAKLGEIADFVHPPPAPLDTRATFIGGSRSTYLAPQHHDTVRKFFGNADIHMIQGASHWLHAEKPKAFKDLVVAHLRKHSLPEIQ